LLIGSRDPGPGGGCCGGLEYVFVRPAAGGDVGLRGPRRVVCGAVVVICWSPEVTRCGGLDVGSLGGGGTIGLVFAVWTAAPRTEVVPGIQGGVGVCRNYAGVGGTAEVRRVRHFGGFTVLVVGYPVWEEGREVRCGNSHLAFPREALLEK